MYQERKPKRCLGHSRKGNMIVNGIIFVIAIFVFVMISFFGFKIYSDMSPYIKADVNDSVEAVAAYEEVEDRYPNVFTGLIILVLIGFWSFIIVSAFMSTEHPILFIFMIILSIFLMISTAILGNFYKEFFSDAEYTALTSSFAIPHFLMTHILEITMGALFTGILVMFAKNRYE